MELDPENQDYTVRYLNAATALDQMAAERGSSIGWTFEDLHVSFEDMRRRSIEVARSLLALGVSRGDRVACIIPNLPEFADWFFGCARIGAVIVPFNTRSGPFELRHVLQHSDAKVLLVADRVMTKDLNTLVMEVVGEEAFGAPGSIASAEFPSLATVVAIPRNDNPRFLPYDGFIAQGASVSEAEVAEIQESVGPDDALLIQYTSGTTALPKGALLSHLYVLNFGPSCYIRVGANEGEAVFNTQPIYHSGGSAGTIPVPVVLGYRMVMAEVYDPRRTLELIEREKCVTRSGFIAMYLAEVEHPDFDRFDISSLRSAWSAGAPSLIKQVTERMGLRSVLQLYGCTEGLGTCNRFDDPEEKRLFSIGRPIADMEMAILDPDTGSELPPGEIGEICMRGWATMIGYFKQPEETARVKDADGWVHSGDLGMVDEDGFFHFRGRIKNMIRVGGENVSAEEVEALILEHPKVKVVAVIAKPDPRFEEVVQAIIELKADEQATEAEIIDYCKPRMANFRVPRSVKFISEWPMTESGKIQMHVLKKQIAALDEKAEVPA